MSEWKEYRLGEIINVKHGYAFRGEYFSETPTLDILLTPGNFSIGGGFKEGKLKYYNGEYPISYKLNEGDVIVTMTDLSKEGDTLGYSAKIPKHNEIRYLHNQRIGLLQFIKDDFSKDYIYWVLRSRDYQKFIVNSATGSTVKHTSPSRICEYVFSAPDLHTQTAIAEILSSLDDKIELNNKINQELETLAQTLFKQWFIDFEFPNENGEPYKSSGGEMVESELGEIPKGWEVDILENHININNGYAFKSDDYIENGIKIIRTKNFNENGYLDLNDLVYLNESESDKYTKFILQLYDKLVVMVGASIGKSVIVTSNILPALQNQNMWNFRAKNKIFQSYTNFLTNIIIEQNLGSATGSAREFFRKDFFYSRKILVPHIDIINLFGKIVFSLYDKIDVLLAENKELVSLRDSLLPKLISGEFQMKDH
jgi:type I restriction enzyme S subunit